MDQLLNIMKQLREECPWDQAQTPETLTKYAIEEAYEVEAAVRDGNAQHIKEELGDLLLQVVFQAQMHSEKGLFDFNDVVDAISQKLIRRHPHVFQKEKFSTLNAEEVSHLWKQIKQQEKVGKEKHRLDDVKHAPALIQAFEVQDNVAKIGFDFPDVTGAYGKLEEELDEFKQAIANENSDEMLDEFGDCLFSLINVGRKLGISGEQALLSTIHKFRSRFAFIEDQTNIQNKKLEEMSLEEMDELWEQAKIFLKQQATHATKKSE
jgi:MazG family protein